MTLKFTQNHSDSFAGVQNSSTKLADAQNIYNCTYYVVHKNRPINKQNNTSLKIYTYKSIITMDAVDNRAKLRSRLGMRRELSVARMEN